MGEEGEARLNRDAVYFSIHEVEKKNGESIFHRWTGGESVAIILNEEARFRQFSRTGTPSRIEQRVPWWFVLLLYITYIYICVYCISVYICIHIYIYIHIYTIFLNNTRVWEADRWRWRVVGVKATTGADLNPRPGRWKGSNKSCTRDEDESENTENRPLCRATLCNYFVERRFLHTIPRRTEESVTSTNTKT